MESWFPTFRRIADREIPLPAFWPRASTLTQRHALLRLIALSIEDNLPLSPLLEQWAQDERGGQCRRLKKLARLLQAGTPLPDAIEQIPGIVQEADLLAIRYDAQLGTRTGAIRQMVDDSDFDPANQAQKLGGDIFYV